LNPQLYSSYFEEEHLKLCYNKNKGQNSWSTPATLQLGYGCATDTSNCVILSMLLKALVEFLWIWVGIILQIILKLRMRRATTSVGETLRKKTSSAWMSEIAFC
jgi:hypothetical protein